MTTPSREEAVFQAAAPMADSARAALLDQACAGDAALRARLERLLAAHDQPDTLPGEQHEAVRPTIGLEFAEAPDEAVGQTIGRYKLLEKLGEGGCGVVYVAEQTEPVRRRVALKVIKLGMDTKQVVARFEAERQALAMMDHPNIAKVLDAGMVGEKPEARSQNSGVRSRRSGDSEPLTPDARPLAPRSGRPYFVMELVRGIKITDYCDQANLSTQERLGLFIKVCQAIQHAHQKGIIHRDIKPSNILVTLHDGVPVPKVIDFGIAKATEGRLTDATVYTQLHQFIGTPAYMSPEQAEMSGLDIDTRSDIYSLGVLLYELLTGQTPFDARELMSQGIDAMRRTIREQEPVRPSTRLTQTRAVATAKSEIRNPESEIEEDLDWIVMKCLEKDRARRYETANGLAADLKRHLNNEPVVARPPSAAYRFQKGFRRHKLVFAAGTVVTIALVAGLGVSNWQWARARRAEQAERAAADEARAARDIATEAERKAVASLRGARRAAYLADMRLVDESWRTGNIGRARRILAEHLPPPGQEDLRDWEWHYFARLAQTDEGEVIGSHPGAARHLLTSAGDVFVTVSSTLRATFTDSEGQVQVWDGLRRRRLARGDASTEAGPQVRVWERSWQQPRAEFVAPTDATAVALSRDGTRLAIARGRAIEIRRLDELAAPAIVLTNGIRPVDHLREARIDVMLFVGEDTRLAIAGRAVGPEAHPLGFLDIVTDTRTTPQKERPLVGVVSLARSDDGRFLAVTRQEEVVILRLPEGSVMSRFGIENARSASREVNPAIFVGDRLVTASEGGRLDVWDVLAGQLLRTLGEHGTVVAGLAATPDGRRVASSGSDHLIRLWDVTSERTPVRVLRGHEDAVRGVGFLGNELLVSCGQDQTVRRWDLRREAAEEAKWLLPSGYMHATVRQTFLGAVNRDMRWTAWDTSRLPGIAEPTLVTSSDQAVAFPLPGTASRLTIPEIYTELRPGWGVAVVLRGGSGWNTPVAGFPEMGVLTDPAIQVTGRRLFLHGIHQAAPHLLVWSTAEERLECLLRTTITNCWAMGIAPDRSAVVLGDQAGRLEWLNLASGEAEVWVGALPGAVSALAILPDNRTVFAASALGPLQRIDWPGRYSEEVPGSLLGIEAMSLSLDGTRLATGDAQGTIRLWDVETLREVAVLGRHPGRVGGVLFHPDGRTLLSVDANELRVWHGGAE